METKRKLIAIILLAVFVLPMLMGALGDMEIGGDLKLITPGKEIRLYYGPQDYQYIEIEAYYGGSNAYLRIPALNYSYGNFLTTTSDGTLVFIDTAAYEGDIQSVWDKTVGDVGALKAASGDTLDATSADSTVPWKVNTTAAPTTEGQAVWDPNADTLNVGNGTSTMTLGPPTHPPISPTAPGKVGQMAYDTKWVYCYVGTNTWRRAALATWTESCILDEDGWQILDENGDFILQE